MAYDEGKFYPHHNVYVITSKTFDLRVLQTLLRSSIALAFVAAYCVRMTGGFLRFQAQYLRRIRIPSPKNISKDLMDRLRAAAESNSQADIDGLALEAYALSMNDAEILCDFAAEARASRESK